MMENDILQWDNQSFSKREEMGKKEEMEIVQEK